LATYGLGQAPRTWTSNHFDAGLARSVSRKHKFTVTGDFIMGEKGNRNSGGGYTMKELNHARAKTKAKWLASLQSGRRRNSR
jgi:hypothetical protein